MSPRKVRLVTDAVKGKNVNQVDVELSFMPKKAARIIQTLIRSAAHNAKNNEGLDIDSLMVKSIEVNQGVTLKRWRARARGSAAPINKRTSNISVSLAEITEKKKSNKVEEKKENNSKNKK
jgi:large subunit ribosomal protein L22